MFREKGTPIERRRFESAVAILAESDPERVPELVAGTNV